MPRRVVAGNKKVSTPVSDTPINDTASFKLPNFSLQNKNYVPFLVILLIIGSFFLGSLSTKVSYLEKNSGGTNQQAQVTPAPDNGQGQPPAVGQKVDVANGTLPALGNKDAKVKIVVFSDFECPFCEKFYTDAYAQIKKEYVDTEKVALYFRHFPLEVHPAALPTAEASECANDQGKFWNFHDLVFGNQTKISSKSGDELKTILKGFAGEIGLNSDQFNSCLDSEKYKSKVTQDQQDGTKAGVNGTPSVFVNGRMIVGAQPFSAFKPTIDEELNK